MLVINKKLLVQSVVVCVVIIGSLGLLHTIQADRIPNALRWQAEKAIDAGNTHKAIGYIQRYLEFRPDDHLVALELASLIEQRNQGIKDRSKLLFLYEKVLREAPEQETARRKLVEICLQMNRYGDVLLHAEPLLRQFPDDASVLEMVAQAQIGLNQNAEAAKSLQLAIQHKPEHLPSYERLANLYLQDLNRGEEVPQLLHQMVVQNPKNANAYLTRARLMRNRSPKKDLVQDLEQTLALATDQPEAMLLLSEVYQSTGDIHRSRKLLMDGMQKHGKDARFYRAMSWLEANMGNINSALATLEEGCKAIPNNAELVTPLADLYIEYGKPEKANDLLKVLEKDERTRNQARYIAGRLHIARKEWSAAISAFEKLRTEAVELPSLAVQLNSLLALCYEKVGKRELQKECLDRALAIDPSHLPSRIAKGNFAWLQGQIDAAIYELLIATRSPGCGIGTWLTAGRLQIAKQRALINPQWNGIEQFCQTFRQQFPQVNEPIQLQAELLQAQGKRKAAIQLIREEIRSRANQPTLWYELARFVEAEAGYRKALLILDEAFLALGDSAALRLAKLRLAENDPVLLQAIVEEPLPRQTESLIAKEKILYLNGLTEWYISKNRPKEALKVLEQLLQQQPKDPFLLKFALNYAYESNSAVDIARYEELSRQVEGKESITIEVAKWLYLLRSNSDQFDLATTKLQVQKWLQTRGDLAELHSVMGYLHEREGDMAAAMKEFDLATQLDRSNLLYIKDVLRIAAKVEEESVFQSRVKWLAVDPRMDSDRLLQTLEYALFETEPKKLTKSLQFVAPFIAQSPRSVHKWLQLAERLQIQTEAITWLAGSMQNSSHPDLLARWIEFLSKQQDRDRLQVVLANIKTKLTEEEYYQVAIEQMGNIHRLFPDWQPEIVTAQARKKYLEVAFQQMVLRKQLKEAGQFLTKIEKNGKGSEEEKSWVERSKTLLAVMSANSNADTKQPILQTSFTNEAKSPNELRAQIAVLSVSLKSVTGEDRQQILSQGIRLLQQLKTQGEAKLQDELQLVRFYMLRSERATAKESLQNLLQANPNDKICEILAAELGLQHPLDLKLLEQVLPRLMPRYTDPKCFDIAGEILSKTQPPQQLIGWLQQLLQDTGHDGNARRDQLLRSARMLLRLTRQQTKETKKPFGEAGLQMYIELSKEDLKYLPEELALHASLGNVSLAIQKMQAQRSRLPLPIQLECLASILREDKPSPKEREWIETSLQEAITAEPDSKLVQLYTAEVYMLLQDHVKATPLYEQILQHDAEQVIAKNNLAWIHSANAEHKNLNLQRLQDCIRQLGAIPELLDTRARVWISTGDWSNARRDLQDAMTQGESALRYFHLALLRSKTRENAKEAFQRAQQLGLKPNAIHPADLEFYLQMQKEVSSNQP